MTSVGYATLDVIPSFRGLQRELDKGTTGPLRNAGTKGGTIFGDAAGKAGGSRFGSIFKKAAQASLVGVAALAAGSVKLAMDSVSAASDLEESTNKVSQVFGGAADSVLKFTSTTADALGQSNTQAREAAATFGIFGSAAGLADKKNARFAKRMTTLASDLASFNNTEPGQAVEALGAALRGESEPIRAYGVMLDEATLKAEALRLGILKPVKDKSKILGYQVAVTEAQAKYNEAVAKTGKDSLDTLKAEANLGTARDRLTKATEGTLEPLNKQQKLLAAQSEIFKQTSVAQGDFSRTSDGLANQQRRMKARFEDAKAALGKGLLPIMTDAADFLLEKGIPAFERFADWFTEDGIPAIKKFGDRAEVVADKVADLVGWLKELPDPAKYAGLAALLGGGAALKLRGGSNGALGTAGKALGMAKPIPVFVTNKGAFPGGSDLPDGKPKVPPILAGNSSLLNKFIKMGGPGGLIALSGMFADRGIVDEKGNEAKVADAKRTAKYLAELTPKLQLNADMAEKMRANAAGFHAEIDLIGSSKVTPEIRRDSIKSANDALARFVGYQIEAGRPVTPYINTTSIERALALLRTMNAEIRADALPSRGVDNGTTYQHGGTGTNGRAGVNFNGPIHVEAHDYDDFTRQLERKTQAAGLGGRP